ncbi:MAG: NAD(P)-dependent oxidoreductase [Candidatus Hodarchaeales archaeon]|jgi:phosphoglycerate dehydrogenase-like enzyme
MNKLKIVDFSTLPEKFTKDLFEGYMDYTRFEIVRAEKDMSIKEKCAIVKDADILLSDSAHMNPIPRQIIESAEKLKLIQCYTIGYDDIDIDAAREKGIPVANSAGILSKPMAEYTIMSALYLIKSIEYAYNEFKKGIWVQQELLNPKIQPLEFGSLTLGIIGCGSVGQEVAKLAKGFGTRILYHNRRRLHESIEYDLGLEYSSFEDILKNSDVLSVNVPLTSETKGMIGVKEIALMKKGAVLINTARGEVIDVYELANAIKSGHLRGVAVDVFVNEPNIEDCPLVGLDNVILTPHCSAISPDSVKRVPPKVMENLNRIYEGKPPLRVVN